ncbi:Malate dehydrogenase 2 [Durusdinium trenchii]
MTLTEEDPAGNSHPEFKQGLHEITGGSAAVAPVDEWRVPRTVTTISFADGHVSRAYVTLRSGSMPESTRRRLNKELDKFLFIEQQQVSSHIWNESTQVKFLSFLAQEVRARRKMLGLDASARALVLMDQASAHMSKRYERIQQQWSKQNNIELMSGRSATPVPGGFGAAAGPNDGWHQWLHALTKSYLRLAVGWGSWPQLRTRLDELQMGLQSQPSTKHLDCAW